MNNIAQNQAKPSQAGPYIPLPQGTTNRPSMSNTAPPHFAEPRDARVQLPVVRPLAKSIVGWQIACWLVMLLGTLGGLIYVQYQPDAQELVVAEGNDLSSLTAPTWLKTTLAKIDMHRVELADSIWRVLPTDSQVFIVRYRLWVLGGLALLAWIALFHSFYQPTRRRSELNLQRACQAEQALHNCLAENRAAAQQISTIADVIVQMGKVADRSTELARTAAETAGQFAKKGSAVAHNAVTGLHNVSNQIQDLVARLKRLGQHAQRINEITILVQECIAQTKLGALNASIRAAAVGEAGRGFITTTEEIQQLAEDSAQHASEITELAQHIEHATTSTLVAMKTTADAVEVGTEKTNEASKTLEEIENASREALLTIAKHQADSSRQTAEEESKHGTTTAPQSAVRMPQFTSGNEQMASAILKLKHAIAAFNQSGQ